MKDNNYYIVAFNKDKPSIINIDNTILKEEDTNKLINIAYIDLLISRYDEETFRNHLLRKHLIDDYNTPIFIAHKTSGHTNKYPYSKSFVHYFSLIFKSKYSRYINNVAITTVRNRLVNEGDAGLLIRDFSKLYYSDSELYDIANEILDKETIEKVINYKEHPEKFKKNPINYVVIRNIVASLTEWDKYKTFERYYLATYGREKYDSELAGILPKNKVIKTEDVRSYSEEELEQIKNSAWDNLEAQQHLDRSIRDKKYYEDELYTLTLEDRLRSGLMSELDYEKHRKNGERDYKNSGRKNK